MKKIALYLALLFSGNCLHAHDGRCIRRIGVEYGGAVMAGIYNSGIGQYKAGRRFDGERSNPGRLLLPCRRTIMRHAASHFCDVVLPHYANGHYQVLLTLKDGRMCAGAVTGPAGYPLGTVVPVSLLFHNDLGGGRNPADAAADHANAASRFISGQGA